VNRIRTIVRTPLHIGGGDTWNPGTYVVDGNIVWFPNLVRVAEWVASRKLDAEFLRAIQRRTPLATFLVEQGALAEPTEWAQRGIPWQRERPTGIIRGALTNAWGHPYIPGSTLKGAWRAAKTSLALGPDAPEVQEALQSAVKRLTDNPRSRRQVSLHAAASLERRWRTLSWPGHKRNNALRDDDLHRDKWRALAVRDSEALPSNTTVVYPVRVWTKRANGTVVPGPTIWVECLPPGTEIVWTWVSRFGIPPLSVNASVLSEWGSRVWETDREALKEWPRRDEAVTDVLTFYESSPRNWWRLGWGSGWLSLSMAPILSTEQRRVIGRSFYGTLSGFPRSRRWVDTSEGWRPMGWVENIATEDPGTP
jgi:hypothetical protein